MGGKITKKETAAEEKSVKAKNTASKAASKTSETAGTEKTVGAEKSAKTVRAARTKKRQKSRHLFLLQKQRLNSLKKNLPLQRPLILMQKPEQKNLQTTETIR